MQTVQLAKGSVSLAHVATEDSNDVKMCWSNIMKQESSCKKTRAHHNYWTKWNNEVNPSNVPWCRSCCSLYFVFVNRSVATTRSLEDSQEMDPCVFFWGVFFVVYISLPRFKRGWFLFNPLNHNIPILIPRPGFWPGIMTTPLRLINEACMCS